MRDHQAKLAWAEKHLAKFRRSVSRFIQKQPYTLLPEEYPAHGKCVCRMLPVVPIPKRWSLLVGDIIHNLRGSLDSLVYQLARQTSGAKADTSTELQFPIADSSYLWHWRDKTKTAVGQKRRVALLSAEAQTVIETLQRYRGKDPAQWHPITVLRDLSNQDKHRRLVFTGAAINSIHLTVKYESGWVNFHRSPFRGAFDASTPVAEFPLVPGQTVVDVDHMTSIDIAFALEWPGHGRPVRTFFADTVKYIREEAFPPLEALLR